MYNDIPRCYHVIFLVNSEEMNAKADALHLNLVKISTLLLWVVNVL